MTPPSQMRVEAQQASEAVARLLQAQRECFERVGASWRAQPPRSVVTVARGSTSGAQLPLVESEDVDFEPIGAVQALYPMVEALARARGLDPDRPHHLSKVTRTI